MPAIHLQSDEINSHRYKGKLTGQKTSAEAQGGLVNQNPAPYRWEDARPGSV